ncbi:MAG: DinB family protein [Planctomycetes bacterium]|nr:DinB family protein [Planctomycetota bacterium]
MKATDILAGRCVLERTPLLLRAWLAELPNEWLDCDEGEGTWSPRSVVGHLVEGERTDWIPRVRHILLHGDALAFPPFDRSAHLRSTVPAMHELLEQLRNLRARSLADLDALKLASADLARRGLHPELGVVTLGQHLATWVAHDLGHIAQIARVMARRQAHFVGPWRAYLPVLAERGARG